MRRPQAAEQQAARHRRLEGDARVAEEVQQKITVDRRTAVGSQALLVDRTAPLPRLTDWMRAAGVPVPDSGDEAVSDGREPAAAEQPFSPLAGIGTMLDALMEPRGVANHSDNQEWPEMACKQSSVVGTPRASRRKRLTFKSPARIPEEASPTPLMDSSPGPATTPLNQHSPMTASGEQINMDSSISVVAGGSGLVGMYKLYLLIYKYYILKFQ